MQNKIDDFIETCKLDNNWDRIKESDFICNLTKQNLNLVYESMCVVIEELCKNNRTDLVIWLFETNIIDAIFVNNIFWDASTTKNLTFAKTLWQMNANLNNVVNIETHLFDACNNAVHFDVGTVKNLFAIEPNLDVEFDDDCLMRNLCCYQTDNCIDVSDRLEMIKLLLEMKPDYDVVILEEIKNGILYRNLNFCIIKFLSKYIENRKKIDLENTIEKIIKKVL